MAYTINNTAGTTLKTLADGTIDTATTDLTLIGKGYAGFGERLNENFVKLLENKKILIDGQQRVTALTAAILGDYVINKDYQRVRIKIAFNPIEEKFEVQTQKQ